MILWYAVSTDASTTHRFGTEDLASMREEGTEDWKDSKALELRNVRVATLTRLQKHGCLTKTTPINKPNQGQDPYTY